MSRLSKLPATLRGLLQNETGRPVTLVAERFLQAFREHGVATAQIPRLLPEVKLDDLQSSARLLAVLTPTLLDRVAKLFGIRPQWLEGVDDRIYEYLGTYKNPRKLLDQLHGLWHRTDCQNEPDAPLRILSTSSHLDYRSPAHPVLAPILVEPIAMLGDETIYRYHIYQDGYCWDHPPARIELKAIALTAYRGMHWPLPIHVIDQRDMTALLEGRRIPRSLLDACLLTDPSLEDFVLDKAQSVVAKETEELPAVLDYMARAGLDTYAFRVAADEGMATDTDAPASHNPKAEALTTAGKRQAQRDHWRGIEAAAITLWNQDKTLAIAQVVRQLQAIPAIKANALQPDTLRKRIAKLAPKNIRGKPGRRPKETG